MSLTFSDKNRPIKLICDAKWHYASIFGKASVHVDDGTYIVLVAVHGKIVTLPKSNMEVRGQRYPTGDSTGWSEVGLHNRVDPSVFFGTFSFKVTVKAGSVSSTEAHDVGFDYRIRGGAITLEHRILKFLKVA